MKWGAAAVLALLADAAAGGVAPYEAAGPVAPRGKLDELVFARLAKLGIPPAANCSDEVFLRRVYLDAIGTLPTADEVTAFLRDRRPCKRDALIDRLLERPEFADYWATKWCDLLRVKSEFPINLWPNSVQAYHRWIHTAVRDNLPYDRFARELLATSGSNFRVGPVNFYRAVQSRDPRGLAAAAALTFMGTRLDRWPTDRADGLAAFFARVGYKGTSEWKEEIIFHDAYRTNAPASGTLPDGTVVRFTPDRDPRAQFADWLVAPDNPWFAANAANRVWSWLLGRGIVHEPDDARPDNPPSNPELLAWLSGELVKSKYDLRHLYRLILRSQTYQLSSLPASTHALAEANFAHYPLRRLDAEVLIDALCQLTGTTEKYSSPIPEPFTFIPENQRSIALADGSISSAFLELFGRPARDTGYESERNNRPTTAQRLHLLNSSHVRRKLEQSEKIRELLRSGEGSRDTVSNIYLAVLSRYPTADELATVARYAGTAPAASIDAAAKPPRAARAPGGNRDTSLDVIWALINTPEFLYRH